MNRASLLVLGTSCIHLLSAEYRLATKPAGFHAGAKVLDFGSNLCVASASSTEPSLWIQFQGCTYSWFSEG